MCTYAQALKMLCAMLPKTGVCLDKLANLPAADLSDYFPDCVVHCPDHVSLNAVNIQTTFMLSANILP